jgi:hypothetical protein
MFLFVINRTQRIALILYCLSLTYCCVWIPWRVPYNRAATAYERAGYGWVWAGPYRSPDVVYNPPLRSSGNTPEILGEVDLDPSPLDAMPDLPRITLRIAAATSISAVAFFVAGLWKSATCC